MGKIHSAVSRFLRDEEGQDIIEYGLLAAFIAIVVTTLLVVFRDPLGDIYQRILDHLTYASGTLPPGPGG